MGTYEVPATGIRQIKAYGVNHLQTEPGTRNDVILIESPHEIGWTIANGVLNLQITKACATPPRMQTVDLGGMTMRIKAHLTKVVRPSGIVVSQTNRL